MNIYNEKIAYAACKGTWKDFAELSKDLTNIDKNINKYR